MGQAKNKAAKAAGKRLDGEGRAQMLGENPFAPAYDLLYGMVERVFTTIGGVSHELIGIDFEAGKPVGVSTLEIKRIEDVPKLRARMLEIYPMVAHVFEAWSAPDASVPAHAHPKRQDIVSVMLHTSDMAAVGHCNVDPNKKTIVRGELVFPSGMGGRLGRELPTRH